MVNKSLKANVNPIAAIDPSCQHNNDLGLKCQNDKYVTKIGKGSTRLMDQIIYGVNRSSVDPQDIFLNMPAFMVTRNSTTTGNNYKLSFMTNPTLSNLEPEFTFKSEIKLTGTDTSLGTLIFANNEYYKEVSTGDIAKCPIQKEYGQKNIFL